MWSFSIDFQKSGRKNEQKKSSIFFCFRQTFFCQIWLNSWLFYRNSNVFFYRLKYWPKMCNLSLFSEIPDNSNNIIFVFDIKTHNSFVIIKDRNVLSFEIKNKHFLLMLTTSGWVTEDVVDNNALLQQHRRRRCSKQKELDVQSTSSNVFVEQLNKK
jgi:hypothetical protein